MSEPDFDVKLTQADLWRMYRQPGSVNALIPVAIILETFREADAGLENPNQRAMRFSEALANELLDRQALESVALVFVFEGELIKMDRDFYSDRLKTYADAAENSPQYDDLKAFVRGFTIDQMLVPLHHLHRLAMLNDRLSLPRALSDKFQALSARISLPSISGEARQQSEAAEQLKIIDVPAAIEILSAVDLTITHKIGGRQEALTAKNVQGFLLERGFKIGENKAAQALSRVKGAGPGRPRNVMTKNDGS